jgi:hypothetical protein
MKKVILGLATGFANGLFGAGGGTLLVPGLEKFLATEEHKAHATAIAVILPLSVISAVLYIKNIQIPLGSVIKLSIGGMVGGFTGAILLNKIPKRYLHIIFGFFMLAAAYRMIFSWLK